MATRVNTAGRRTKEQARPRIEVRPIGGRTGAEISGTGPLDSLGKDGIATLRDALLRHKVVFIRGQRDLTDEAHEQFARLLGSPVAHPTVTSQEGSQYLLELDSRYGGRTNSWHTDVTFVPAYPAFSILRALVVPDVGGDTLWANTAAAYSALPEPLRQFADGLRAVHTNDYDYVDLRPDGGKDQSRAYELVREVYETEHPLVRVHPETGERALILGHFVKQIAGLGKTDSAALVAMFQAHITRPENVVRWQWQVGDVAIWDNRATQHYASHDYDEHRVMRRATVAGDVPIGIDGRPSVGLQRRAAN